MSSRTARISVREARDRFSELVRRAAQGESFAITSHGESRALLSGPQPARRAFRVDWKWLREMDVAAEQTPAETIVREQRDGRD